MRSINHLLYTPAPDIVHEAAGHAPIIIDPEYAAYLKEYAQIAKKAIISKEDLDLYEAIRELSDIKENPQSTPEMIIHVEQKLNSTIKASTHTSEATELSRMNWWTAEYGLVGDLENPKIFGAGLLSSVGESKWCLSEKVKKIPLSVDCIKQTYDITEPQPQLFVTPDFKTLVSVLHEMANKMAFKTGGTQALDKAILAKSVNTVELDTHFQISGLLTEYLKNSQGEAIYLKFAGPTQISIHNKQINGHDKNYHKTGYSTPIGEFTAHPALNIGQPIVLNYSSGITVQGVLTKTFKHPSHPQAEILSFEHATVTYKNEILFHPDWGTFDLVTGKNVTSVFGGPADRDQFGETDDFVAVQVPLPFYSRDQKIIFQVFQNIRDFRNNKTMTILDFNQLLRDSLNKAGQHWLVILELLEIAIKLNASNEIQNKLKNQLDLIKSENEKLSSIIEDGVRLAYAST